MGEIEEHMFHKLDQALAEKGYAIGIVLTPSGEDHVARIEFRQLPSYSIEVGKRAAWLISKRRDLFGNHEYRTVREFTVDEILSSDYWVSSVLLLIGAVQHRSRNSSSDRFRRLSPDARYEEMHVEDGVSEAVRLQRMLAEFAGRTVAVTIEPIDSEVANRGRD